MWSIIANRFDTHILTPTALTSILLNADWTVALAYVMHAHASFQILWLS